MNDKLEQCKLKYDYVIKIRELNQQQPIFKIPKYIILKNILPFLEDDEIVPFALVCKTFRTIVFSPIGLEILLAARARAFQAQIIQSQNPAPQNQPIIPVNTNESLKKFEGNREDALAQLETLKNVKEFLTVKVKTLEDEIKKHQKDILKIKGNLLHEQNLNRKNVEKIHSLNHRLESLRLEKEDHEGTIREVNFHYQKLVNSD